MAVWQGDREIEVFNTATEGVGCQIWTPTCWDNSWGTPGYFPDEEEREFGAWVLDKRPESAPAPGRAVANFPHVLTANLDALIYEVGRIGTDDLEPLADNNWTKDFVAGVIEVKTTITETADEVADRIRQALGYVPAVRLGLSTDCGLINLRRMIAFSKLRALPGGASIVGQDLRG